MRVNDPDNFAGRVNYAAQVISRGGSTSRTFDSCFENYDGDAVAVALARRAEKNPKLAANMPRYLDMALIGRLREQYHGAHLPTVARELREDARIKFEAWKATWQTEQAHQASGAQADSGGDHAHQ